MIPERGHHVIQFFVGDEPSAVPQFVVVDRLGKLVDFWTIGIRRRCELTTFDAGWAGRTAATINKPRRCLWGQLHVWKLQEEMRIPNLDHSCRDDGRIFAWGKSRSIFIGITAVVRLLQGTGIVAVVTERTRDSAEVGRASFRQSQVVVPRVDPPQSLRTAKPALCVSASKSTARRP
jgi:hypothetical protein